MSRAFIPLSIAVQAREPVIVIGAPGTGKTQLIEQGLGPALDLPVETYIVSIHDPADLNLPYLNDKHGVSYAMADFIIRLNELGKGIIFLDELSTAPPASQASVLRLIQERQLNGKKLADGICFVAAMNPVESAAGGNELSAPLANRFCHLEWSFDVTAWIDNYLMGNNRIPTFPRVPEDWRKGIQDQYILVAGFNKAKPQAALALPKNEADMGKAWPSPRSWDMAARLRAAGIAAQASKEALIQLTCGAIGNGMGIEFMAWVDALDLPNPEDLLAKPDSFKVPERGDRTFTILASVAQAVIGKMNKPRYLAAWHIFHKATQNGQKDVAAASIVNLVREAAKTTLLGDKEVRDEMRVLMAPFKEILVSAGLGKGA